MIPIFLGFSFETMMVASFKNPEIRTGFGLNAGNLSKEAESLSPESPS